MHASTLKVEAREELFSHQEVALLRNELRECELDCWQAGELIEKFVRGHGFGISPDAARLLAAEFDCTLPLEDIARQLAKAAWVM